MYVGFIVIMTLAEVVKSMMSCSSCGRKHLLNLVNWVKLDTPEKMNQTNALQFKMNNTTQTSTLVLVSYIYIIYNSVLNSAVNYTNYSIFRRRLTCCYFSVFSSVKQVQHPVTLALFYSVLTLISQQSPVSTSASL